MATDSAAAFKPANTPVFSGGISAVSRGQLTAVAAPLPIPATTTTTATSASEVTNTPPTALTASSAQPIASTRRVPMRVDNLPKTTAPIAVNTSSAADRANAVCCV